MANVAVFVSLGAVASMGGMSALSSDSASVGTIGSLPLIEIKRIATTAIPTRLAASATHRKVGRDASDPLSIRTFQGPSGLISHILNLRDQF
jgi:hypothetical protein